MLSNLWTHVKPTYHQIIGYVVLAIILLLSSYYNEIARFVSQEDSETGIIGFIKARISGYLELLQGNGILDAVTFFLIIVGLGALAYLVIWLTMNFFSQLAQNVDFKIGYIHPKEYYDVKHWIHVGVMFLLQVVGLIVFAVYSLFWLDTVVPAVEDRVHEFFDNSGVESVLGALSSLILLVVSFHIFTLILRAIFHTYPDKTAK